MSDNGYILLHVRASCKFFQNFFKNHPPQEFSEFSWESNCGTRLAIECKTQREIDFEVDQTPIILTLICMENRRESWLYSR